MSDEKELTERDIAEADYRAELRKWDDLQVDIARLDVQGGLVKQSLRLDALVQILMDKGICTQEEADITFLRTATHRLGIMRAEVAPRVAEAKLAAARARILPPPGFKH